MQPEAQVVVETSEGRRKLIRGGMIGVPVLLALKSTPVLACNCKLPSGFSTSGNLSRNNGDACSDPAKDPMFWQTNLNSNRTKFNNTGDPKVRTNTPFNSVFGGHDTTTFLNILSQDNFASLVVAAYLNIKARKFVYRVSTDDIKSMWAETYQPLGATQPWSSAQSESYLRYTMNLL